MKRYGYLFESYPNNEHDYIIRQIVRLTGCNKYLELGIKDGYHIDQIHNVCEYCVGVDIIDQRKYRNFNFYHGTTDQFFETNTETFDIIFIDADHSFESVKKDFINSLKVLNKFGIILIHDTDPISDFYKQPIACGDSYKMVDWIEQNYPELKFVTLPITEAGLTIVNRKYDRRAFL